MAVTPLRINAANQRPIRPDGDYVLYWMTAFRRTHSNFALQRAVEHAHSLRKPLLVFEPLRCGYRWASDRLHQFVIEGMRDNSLALRGKPVTYFPYVEPHQSAADGLLETLAQDACVIVTDDYPCFFLPSLIRTVSNRVPVLLETVDSNGWMPLRLAPKTFTVAHSYRRWMQKNILDQLLDTPAADPLRGRKLPTLSRLPEKVVRRWPVADLDRLLAPGGLADLPIDHQVSPCKESPGGSIEARRRLSLFIRSRLEGYGENRNQPDATGTTELSPYLHFGHIATHELVDAVLRHENWTPDMVGRPEGKNSGFWNTSASAEGLLDQVLTWREMGFNLCFREPRLYDRFESLPDWVLATLQEHASDPRPALYSLEQFENARTHDPVWNASQRQLLLTGVMHNYLRMLWGKNILHWSRSPQDAMKTMINLNNKYALDGRDPNSYSGIFWVLGRYDRPWGPKRPVFGSIRYMTSESAKKKLRMGDYLRRFGPGTEDPYLDGSEPRGPKSHDIALKGPKAALRTSSAAKRRPRQPELELDD
jgi:deoxyribodipyrimidine photo-lyase